MRHLVFILLIAIRAYGGEPLDEAQVLKRFRDPKLNPEIHSDEMQKMMRQLEEGVKRLESLNAQPQRELVSHYSRGHDDFGGTKNYRTADMSSALVMREGLGGSRLSLNFKATLGTSQAAAALQAEYYSLREMKRRYRPSSEAAWTPALFDETDSPIRYKDKKFAKDAEKIQADHFEDVVSGKMDEVPGAAGKNLEASLDLRALKGDGEHEGEAWIQARVAGEAFGNSEADPLLKHKVLWKATIKDGKVVSADVWMEQPAGRGAEKHLSFQGTYQVSSNGEAKEVTTSRTKAEPHLTKEAFERTQR